MVMQQFSQGNGITLEVKEDEVIEILVYKNGLFWCLLLGRMAPPVDDLSPKKVKVVVGVSRKHSDNEAESIADALSSTSNILASEFFEEEKQESPKSTFSPAPR